jgi:hypothetical protein
MSSSKPGWSPKVCYNISLEDNIGIDQPRPRDRRATGMNGDHAAMRNTLIFLVSWRSAMNFARAQTLAETKRKSGSVWRSAWATTISEGGMPGRMVRNQDPKEFHTSLGAMTAELRKSG